MRRRSLWALAVSISIVAACGDSSGPEAVGPLVRLSIQSGNTQNALAGTALSTPIIIVPQDEAGRTVVDQTATFTVTAGGGFLSSSTGQANPDGTITAPTWTLGKTDIPQEMTVNVAGKTNVVAASVQTGYVLAVRFYGAPISAANQAVFTTAAARVRGFIVGGVPPVNMDGAEMDFCTGAGSAPLAETVSGLLIFASVDSIDGPGVVLAQAGACYFRSSSDFRTIVGLMRFDSADIGSLAGGGRLQEVITHEMLHVVGLGSYWGPDKADLLTGSGAPGAGYTGAAGIAGCRDIGGTGTCATSVPVEDCVGLPSSNSCGPGQRDVHWKETTFGRELMTAYLSGGVANPLSVMSIRSFEDLGYTVNTAAADTYTMAAFSALRAADDLSSSPTASRHWERPLPFAPRPFRAVRGASGNAR
jgi:hypothetical protein